MVDTHANFPVRSTTAPTDQGYGSAAGSTYRNGLKRVFDLGFAVLIAPLVLPLIGVLWALVRLDGGSGFYRQKRVGRGGATYWCLKLRTMKPDAEAVLSRLIAEDADAAREWATHQKLDCDPRITPLGSFLRRASLDELPQYFNVLAGQMSFVGPRPFMVDQAGLYRSCGGTAYFDLRPGITGAWQVEARHNTQFATRVRFDEIYGQTISLGCDLQLLARTVGAVARMTGR